MLVLVTYDIGIAGDNGKKRLRNVAKICENYGQRVQNSVFECLVDPALWVKFMNQLKNSIDPKEDSLRFYFLGSNWKGRVEHIGAKSSYDPEGVLII
ncbi:MAG: CRISPR-associated endonuclease Cas2 [Parachlamydiaceae bacterium]